MIVCQDSVCGVVLCLINNAYINFYYTHTYTHTHTHTHTKGWLGDQQATIVNNTLNLWLGQEQEWINTLSIVLFDQRIALYRAALRRVSVGKSCTYTSSSESHCIISRVHFMSTMLLEMMHRYLLKQTWKKWVFNTSESKLWRKKCVA